MKRLMVRVGFFIIMSICAQLGLHAAENARLPYNQIYAMQQVQTKLSQVYTNVHVFLKMSSRNTDIKNSEIRIQIEAQKGTIPIQLAQDGSFSVPMNTNLEKENPWIVVNQPKGTMQLEWSFALNSPMSPRMKYQSMMKGLKELDPIQTEMLRVFPGAPKLTINGLKLIFGGEKKDVAVVIRAKGGDRVLKANGHGEVVVPLDKVLFEENPEVVLPAVPVKIDVAGRKEDA